MESPTAALGIQPPTRSAHTNLANYHQHLRDNPRLVPFFQFNASRKPFITLEHVPTWHASDETRNREFLMVVFDFAPFHAQGQPVDREDHELVEKILLRNGIDVEAQVYITHVFKIAPDGGSKNRSHHLVDGVHYRQATNILREEMAILRPKVVLCIGRYASTCVVAARLDSECLLQRERWHSLDTKEVPEFVDDESAQRATVQSGKVNLTAALPSSATTATKSTMFVSNTLSFVAMKDIQGVMQRLYVPQIDWLGWAMGMPNPRYILGLDPKYKDTRIDEWIGHFAQIKTHLHLPLPICTEYIETVVGREFTAKGEKPDTHLDVLSRFHGSAYSDIRRETWQKTLDGGRADLEFQITKIEYDASVNEYDIYGKTMEGRSVFCTLPHMHGERIHHFYMDYPSSWRRHATPTMRYPGHPQFDYEVDHEADTSNHIEVLKQKTRDIQKAMRRIFCADEPVHGRQPGTIYNHHKKPYQNNVLLAQTSNCTEKLWKLCGPERVPPSEAEWSVLDEVCDIALERVFRLPFRYYDTQVHPRIKVSIKHSPATPWVVAILRDMLPPQEKVCFYEVDCTAVQRLTLHNNIYVGGWAQVRGGCYQIVTGLADVDAQGIAIVERYRKHRSGLNPLGLKRSACDIEVITFREFVRGHNPNLDLDLSLESNLLEEMRGQIVKSVQRVRTEKFDSGPREKAFLTIQERRTKHIDQRVARIKAQKFPDGAIESALTKWSRNAPMTLLIMDIECMTDGTTFPSAEHCPIISIVGYVQKIDHATSINQDKGTTDWDEIAWFSIGPVDRAKARAERRAIPDVGTPKVMNIYCFASEQEMLRAWLLFRADRDPDIEIGHNIESFDMPYLTRRCELSGAYDRPLMNCLYGTRKLFAKIRVSKTTTFSKAFGEKEQSMVSIPGCSCMDTLTIFQREEKLSSYSLNALALEKFDDKKADLPYVAIPGTFYRDRTRLMMYNDKDVNITARLFLNKNTAISSIEFIKLAGVFCQQDIYVRGAQFKVLNSIMRSIVNDGGKYCIESSAADVDRMASRALVVDYDRLAREAEATAPLNANKIIETLYDDELSFSSSDDDADYGKGEEESGSDDEDDNGFSGGDGDILEYGVGQILGTKRPAKDRWGGPASSEAKKKRHVHQTTAFEDDDNIDPQSLPNLTPADIFTVNDVMQRIAKKEQMCSVEKMGDLAQHIDENVKDKSAERSRPLVIRTAAEIRHAAERGSMKYVKKPTKKDKDAQQRAVANTKPLSEYMHTAGNNNHRNSTNVTGEKRAHDATRDAVETIVRKKRARTLRAQAAAAAATEESGAKYKGAICIEPVRGFHVEKAGDKWKAKFIACCDFSSLYPTTADANNICHDKKVSEYNMVRMHVPQEFCRTSTEAWPEHYAPTPKDAKDGFAYFVQSGYRPIVFDRCRENTPGNRKALEATVEMLQHSAKWQFVLDVYRAVLRHWDTTTTDNGTTNDTKTQQRSLPSTPFFATASEYDPAKDEYARLFECVTLDEEIDYVLLHFWEDDYANDVAHNPSQGILPKYLTMCLKARALVKNDMKKAKKGSAQHQSLDGQQLSLKILANSGYGVTGSTGKLGDYAISATITGYGRLYLQFSTNFFVKGNGKTYTFKYTISRKDESGTTVDETREETFVFRGGKNYGGDTDSFFNEIYGIGEDMLKRMGQKNFEKFLQILADEVNAVLPGPMRLLFEKIMFPLMLVNKKRYAYVDFDRTKICFKGLEVGRRDNAAVLRDMQTIVFQKMLLELDIQGAIDYVREKARDLAEGKVDIMNLVSTRQYYKSDYKVETLPHLVVMKKIEHRGGPPAALGSRIPFVFIKGPPNVKNSSLNAEDPVYALERDLVPDYDYYLEKQIRKPMVRIFSRIPGIDTEEKATGILFSNLTRKKFGAKLQEHHEIFKYAKRKQNCVVCGEESFNICCVGCSKGKYDVALRILHADLEEKKKLLAHTINVCKICLNQDQDEISCENTHCAEYAPRKRAIASKKRSEQQIKDVEDLFK